MGEQLHPRTGGVGRAVRAVTDPRSASRIRIDGKVAIVTGAAHGQGHVTAKVLAAAGALVYLTDLDEVNGVHAAAEAGGSFLTHNVTDPTSWAAVVERAVADTGRVDVLVNNAGIIEWATMTQTPLATWDRVIAVNQTGPLLGMQAVAPVMRAQGSGSIVNTSSVGGLGGSSPCFAYGASKWALRGMTRGAAQELGPHGIRVERDPARHHREPHDRGPGPRRPWRGHPARSHRRARGGRPPHPVAGE